MHETGHALYEQGLDHQHRFTPRGAAVSLGVHESQSRFWENQIGRTPAFLEGGSSVVPLVLPKRTRLG